MGGGPSGPPFSAESSETGAATVPCVILESGYLVVAGGRRNLAG
jgi:hypothetical protein